MASLNPPQAPTNAHSHTHLSNVPSYASPSIPSMSLHAAAAIGLAITKDYNIGPEFSLTVTVGEIAVHGVPFVTRGASAGCVMHEAFWKVSPT